MAALDFPNDPELNDEFTAGGKTWFWDGQAWCAIFALSAEAPIIFDGETSTISLGPVDGGTA